LVLYKSDRVALSIRVGQGATAPLDRGDGSDAIGAAKKKNDKVDARMIADLLRCNLLPECYMAPTAIRELRRMLRYRKLVVHQATRMRTGSPVC